MEIPAPVTLSMRTDSWQIRRGTESSSVAVSSNNGAHPSDSSFSAQGRYGIEARYSDRASGSTAR
jgi:hypothetical protein